MGGAGEIDLQEVTTTETNTGGQMEELKWKVQSGKIQKTLELNWTYVVYWAVPKVKIIRPKMQ